MEMPACAIDKPTGLSPWACAIYVDPHGCGGGLAQVTNECGLRFRSCQEGVTIGIVTHIRSRLGEVHIHRLHLCVQLKRILAEFPAVAAHLVTAERGGSVEDIVA